MKLQTPYLILHAHLNNFVFVISMLCHWIIYNLCVGVHHTIQHIVCVCVLWICEDKMIRVFIWLLFVSVRIVRWAHWDISLAFHRIEWLTDSNIWIYLFIMKNVHQSAMTKKKSKRNKNKTSNLDFTLNRIQMAKWLSTADDIFSYEEITLRWKLSRTALLKRYLWS